MNAPVELPTARQSRHFNQMANIHDPHWIPVLNKTSPRSQASTQYFDALPSFPSRGSSRPTTPKDTAGSARNVTERAFVQELEAAPVPNPRSRKGSLEPHNRQRSRETEDTMTSSGDDTILSADAPSTAGTRSLLDNQLYTLPRNGTLKAARSFTQGSVVSDRSSIISASKKPSIPTSRYNRKPGAAGSVPGTPVAASPPIFPQSLTESPRALAIDSTQHRTMSSPRLQSQSPQYPTATNAVASQSANYLPLHNGPISPTQLSPPLPTPPIIQELPGEMPRRTSPRSNDMFELPTTALPQMPPQPPSYELSSNRNRKSTASVRTTASVRKKRALHSHPSNPSMRSEKLDNATSPSTTTQDTAPTLTRTKTNESRRSIVTETGPPSEAPSAPLPDLPPRVASKRPSVRQRAQKTSEGNLSLFPQQSTVSHSPSLANSPSKSDLANSSTPPTLHQSPSTFSMNTTTITQSPPRPEAQHHHDTNEADTVDQHKELAGFMRSKSTLIFRRFDDMHVKLLLSIQDEIAGLERELLELEAALEPTSTFGVGDDSEDEYDDDDTEHERTGRDTFNDKEHSVRRRSTKRDMSRSSRGGKDARETREMRRQRRRVKIMSEMRRLLAEYDHLYTNWTLMQKASASQRVRHELESFLSTDVAVSESARTDRLWVEKNGNDLSCLVIGSSDSAGEDRSQEHIRCPSTGKTKILPWNRNKGRNKAKGLGVSPSTTSLRSAAAMGPPGGAGGMTAIGSQIMFNEKKKSDLGHDKPQSSLLTSWFSVCIGKRK